MDKDDLVKRLHDQLGSMIDQIGHPDYSLGELRAGLRQVRDELFALSRSRDEATVVVPSEEAVEHAHETVDGGYTGSALVMAREILRLAAAQGEGKT